MFKKILSHVPKFNARGFTLYELLVSASIIIIIAGIVLYNHKRFETDIEITNLAYRIALEIRQAQVFGISVRQSEGAGLLGFDVGYGIHFHTEIDDSFVLFADLDGDTRYSDVPTSGASMDCPTTAGTECVEKFSIGRSNKIIGWCGILWSDTSNISDQGCVGAGTRFVGFGGHDFFDIRFKRPNPDAIMQWYPQGGYEDFDTPLQQNSFNYLCDSTSRKCNGWAICLESPLGKRKRVVVYETGQISVENVAEQTTCSTL